jgi:formimidoylglutamate deiminase
MELMLQAIKKIWTPWAWLSSAGEPAQWQSNVLLTVNPQGHWESITPNVSVAPIDAQVLISPLIPSFVNAHSHAFQRAFAGMTEHRTSQADDFWSWRQSMYGVANRISPEQLRAIASQLYIELLQGGYTQVCEFHYLQHQPGGTPYDEPLAMIWTLNDAARDVGIGLTVLPVLYERAGFNEPELRADQIRFKQSAKQVWQSAQAITAKHQPLLNAGLAIHSVRAASKDSIQELLNLAKGFHGPIHIHVSEQTAEVNDAKANYGARPIQWLTQEGFLDGRWQLVHATHATPDEIQQVSDCGAKLVICPTTEANLGDGMSDLRAWLGLNVSMTIGSDSHASRDAFEEIRWLEYGQRLKLQQRNISAAPEVAAGSSAQRLLRLALEGGANAAGLEAWGLCVGARADALALNLQHPSLLGIAQQYWLDALVFSSPSQPWRDVLVAGSWAIKDGQNPQAQNVAKNFEKVMRELHLENS